MQNDSGTIYNRTHSEHSDCKKQEFLCEKRDATRLEPLRWRREDFIYRLVNLGRGEIDSDFLSRGKTKYDVIFHKIIKFISTSGPV